MKNLLLSLSLIVISLPAQAAVGWFYADEIAAINKAASSSRFMVDGARGSSLQSISRTKKGFILNLTGGCKIFLKKIPVQRAHAMGMTGPNAKIALKVQKNKSFCKRR